jgi:hydroxymethylbilane synthase
MADVIRVGSRGSNLAIAQANIVIDMLKQKNNDVSFELVAITTEGDRTGSDDVKPKSGKDAFTRALEDQLLQGNIGVAIHSMKDLPTILADGLTIAAVPKREDARDALISREMLQLKDLHAGSKVGTSSERRRVQLSEIRPDIRVENVRGNVDTRVRKLREGNYDAILLAAAGLKRLNLAKLVAEYMPIDLMLPAAGQGALAVEARKHDSFILRVLNSIDDHDSRAAVEAERTFVDRLGGDCNLPVAAYASLSDGVMVLRGMIVHPDDHKVLKNQIQGPVNDRLKLGKKLAETMLSLNVPNR